MKNKIKNILIFIALFLPSFSFANEKAEPVTTIEAITSVAGGINVFMTYVHGIEKE